ncbi:MAG: FimB/Mfa2 family fimbrial subunit [Prevotella sp.]|nr:FimB/Mfa2 family fimbrial subunit [Prevotella sp.]
MKRAKRHNTFVLYAAILSLPLLLLSCSMMSDDRSDCPDCRNTLRVMLRYDYNIQRANMFGDQVQEATVYVVDPQTGIVVDMQATAPQDADAALRATHPMSNPSFAFNFEGLTPGNYRLYAVGRSSADAAFSITAPAIAESIDRLQFTLPASTAASPSRMSVSPSRLSSSPSRMSSSPSRMSVSGGFPAGVIALRLDTIWNTLTPIDVTVAADAPTEATIPLMRLTNDLNIVVFRRDGSLDNSHNRYEVTVTDEVLTLGYDNEPTATASLVYQPFAAWTTETVTDPTPNPSPTREGSGYAPTTRTDDIIAERNAHYDLSLSRLLIHDDARHNARLLITNRETGHEIVNIDLCYYLALARNAYETQHYSVQEYLDREYDYRLDFGFDGSGNNEIWKYMTIHINALSWALRIQNEEL